MPRRSRQENPQPSLLEPALKTAPCIPAIRDGPDELCDLAALEPITFV